MPDIVAFTQLAGRITLEQIRWYIMRPTEFVFLLLSRQSSVFYYFIQITADRIGLTLRVRVNQNAFISVSYVKQ